MLLYQSMFHILTHLFAQRVFLRPTSSGSESVIHHYSDHQPRCRHRQANLLSSSDFHSTVILMLVSLSLWRPSFVMFHWLDFQARKQDEAKPEYPLRLVS